MFRFVSCSLALSEHLHYHSLQVHPNKIPIAMYSPDDLVNDTPPAGVMAITVLSARNLLGADLSGKSDPYVKLKLKSVVSTKI